MKIISFGHRKKTGKDSAARFLIAWLRTEKKIKNIVKVGFSDKVKAVAYSLYTWADLQPGDYYDIEGNEYLKEIVLPKIGLSPRAIWIAIGNGIRRGDPSGKLEATWLHYLFFTHAKCDVIIIKDMRFITEANGVKERQGICVKINRPGAPIDKDNADEAQPDSPLKTLESYDKWDYVIDNDSDIGCLHNKVIEIGREVFK